MPANRVLLSAAEASDSAQSHAGCYVAGRQRGVVLGTRLVPEVAVCSPVGTGGCLEDGERKMSTSGGVGRALLPQLLPVTRGASISAFLPTIWTFPRNPLGFHNYYNGRTLTSWFYYTQSAKNWSYLRLCRGFCRCQSTDLAA